MTSPDTPHWKGLTLEELYRVELYICPTRNRAGLFAGGIAGHPVSRCGRMLQSVQDWINEHRPATAGRRRAITHEEIASYVDRKKIYISKLFKGREVPSADNQQIWDVCRRILRFMLTGLKKGAKLDLNIPEQVIAGRILKLFFEAPERDGPKKIPYYFDAASCDLAMPQRSEERFYTALDMGATLLDASDGRADLFLITGGEGFGHLNRDGQLSERGWASLALAAVGAQVRYVCPSESSSGTSALSEAMDIKKAAIQAGKSGTWPEEVMCLLSRYDAIARQEHLRDAHSRISITPIGPDMALGGNQKAKSKGVTTARGSMPPVHLQLPTILNPFLRFSVYHHRERNVVSTELFIIRPKDASHPVLIGSPEETRHVSRWLKGCVADCPEDLNGGL